jgi:hypothetical protein
MLGFLEDIWHGILDLPFLIIGGLVEMINALIVAIAALAEFLLALLPSFPDPPSEPASGIVGWLLWMVPLGTMLALFTVLVSLWVGFLGVKMALKWVKAL